MPHLICRIEGISLIVPTVIWNSNEHLKFWYNPIVGPQIGAFKFCMESIVKQHSCGQFIGRPQTFVELQLRFKLHFYTRKMQFEM